jgi:hypothetical protein
MTKKTNQKDNPTVELSSGVILNVNKINSTILINLSRKYDRPRPPIWHNPDLDRDEENPEHPQYKIDLAKWEGDISLSMMDTMIGMGTTIKSIPEAYQLPASDEWREQVESSTGFTISDKPTRRYIDWVRYYAANDDDIAEIINAVGRMSGVSEKDVAVATENFRDNAK